MFGDFIRILFLAKNKEQNRSEIMRLATRVLRRMLICSTIIFILVLIFTFLLAFTDVSSGPHLFAKIQFFLILFVAILSFGILYVMYRLFKHASEKPENNSDQFLPKV